MPRMKILNATEQDNFDKPPIFNSEERKKFFDVPIDLQNTIHGLQKSTYKIGCFLVCGYFRATKKFFQPEDSHQQDIEYVARKLEIQTQEFLPKEYPRSRIHRAEGNPPCIHSLTSWAHINLLGEYDFSDEKLRDPFNIRPPKLMAG